MNTMKVLAVGDLVFLNSGTFVSKAINFIQSLKSSDRKSSFSHVGIIVDPSGIIFHAGSRKICCEHLKDVYPDSICMIVRPKASADIIEKALHEIRRYEGRGYPYFRLFLHLIGLARFIHWRNTMVCSELVARYLYFAGLRHRYWYGTTVDQLWDELSYHRDFDVVFGCSTNKLFY